MGRFLVTPYPDVSVTRLDEIRGNSRAMSERCEWSQLAPEAQGPFDAFATTIRTLWPKFPITAPPRRPRSNRRRPSAESLPDRGRCAACPMRPSDWHGTCPYPSSSIGQGTLTGVDEPVATPPARAIAPDTSTPRSSPSASLRAGTRPARGWPLDLTGFMIAATQQGGDR